MGLIIHLYHGIIGGFIRGVIRERVFIEVNTVGRFTDTNIRLPFWFSFHLSFLTLRHRHTRFTQGAIIQCSHPGEGAKQIGFWGSTRRCWWLCWFWAARLIIGFWFVIGLFGFCISQTRWCLDSPSCDVAIVNSEDERKFLFKFCNFGMLA